MTSTRFDPKPDATYGTCVTCGAEQATEADSKEHMSKTLEEARGKGKSSSHRIRIANPSRKHRIEMRTGSIVGEHLGEAMRDLERLVVDGDVTADEVSESLWMHSDFQEAWDEES